MAAPAAIGCTLDSWLAFGCGPLRRGGGDVICHRGGERLAPLHQALWRLVHGERVIGVALAA